ncbi:hypothetical protein V6N11_064645 [Hibiscus sabdariffa]|uniref:Salivary lipocalin n=2 Tax=Hibiscus sabdariffa TaxID=183260 RepID=A0ABR2NDF5_9ROSI
MQQIRLDLSSTPDLKYKTIAQGNRCEAGNESDTTEITCVYLKEYNLQFRIILSRHGRTGKSSDCVTEETFLGSEGQKESNLVRYAWTFQYCLHQQQIKLGNGPND